MMRIKFISTSDQNPLNVRREPSLVAPVNGCGFYGAKFFVETEIGEWSFGRTLAPGSMDEKSLVGWLRSEFLSWAPPR